MRALSPLPETTAALDLGAELEWQPDHLAPSAWHEHVPFAFWLVKALRPGSILELGTHWGVSYGAFCQAVERLGLAARCHAVDSWEGDEHAGHYGAEVFAAVSAVNEQRWRGFSSLLRTSFDDARGYFGPGEIDLLHIDGLHTEAAVTHDFEQWQETLSDRAVVLFHDINVREREFGVWRLWQSLKAEHPHFEFVHGHGLGVLGLGSRIPPTVAALFDASAEPERAAAIRTLFARRGEAVRDRWLRQDAEARLRQSAEQLAAASAAATAAQAAGSAAAEAAAARQAELEARLTAETARLQAERDALKGQLDRLRDVTAADHAALDRLRRQLEVARGERRTAEAERAAREAEARQAVAAVECLRTEMQGIRAHRDAIVASTSWRLTRPLRVAIRLARGERVDLPRLRRLAMPFRRRLGLPQTDLANPVVPAAPAPTLAAPPGLPALPAPRLDPVDIVVCVHNAPEDVRRCLASVLAGTLPPYRLVLVDDGSGPETRELLAGFAHRHGATLIRHEVAQGYTRAANAGLRRTDAPWVVLLNSDTIVTDGWLDRMVEQAAADPRIGILGPLSNTASWQSVPEVQQGGDWAENPLPEGISVAEMGRLVARAAARQALPLPFLNGFCLLLRRRLIEEIGLFDEEIFGAGYGEENDYCVRARKGGWSLAVADDVFIYHAQSRSYSHDRRRALVAQADQALVEKHSAPEHIWPQVHFCRDSLGMAGIRARIGAAVARREWVEGGRARFEGRRIAFILPIITEGGGGNVVLQEAQALGRMGIDVTLLNFSRHRASFEASYGALDIPVLYADDEAGITALAGDPALGFDAVVATTCFSMFWLPAAATGQAVAYYIQDFEPYFFPASDPLHAAAHSTYSMRPEIRRFTKTAWNAEEVVRHGGYRPAVIGPSVDIDLFRPAPGAVERREGPVRVTAMVRPSTPRRQAGLTVQVLQRLRARCGGAVSLTAFGADQAELAQHGLDLSGIHSHGRLDRGAMAALLRESDVFLDLSEYQAMGLTALEAMASGCAVLLPERGGAAEISAAGTAALLVDTADPARAEAAALRLVEDVELRAAMRLAAVAEAARHPPEAAACRMLEAIFATTGRKKEMAPDAAAAPAA
ncbi:glycosyltransferase [Siccirubricoccus deserti]|nr:glycosyltransferase [Siccirubricoccus deserti]